MSNKENNTPIHSENFVIVPAIQKYPEFVKFVQWFATPTQFRVPKTQKEFAKLVGVNEDTLTDWKQHPRFWPLVQQALGSWVKEQIPDAIGALQQKILSKKATGSEIELLLRLGGILTK